jgi:hypothetical protein
MVLDCPQPAGWSTAVDAKTGYVREAGHERQRTDCIQLAFFYGGVAWAFKGIPSKCIQAKCDEAYSGNPMLMFHDLFEEKEVEFDLESGGNSVFKTNKDHSICTGSMTRKVCFGRPDQVLTEDSEEEL